MTAATIETPATAPDHAPLLDRAFALDPQEDGYVIEDINGEIPAWLLGSYYLNGPSRFQRGDVRYRHWLDGDGMVCALHFRRGEVELVHRYVHSTKWREEEEAGRALYRAFGTAFTEDRLVRGIALASPVNVSIYRFGSKLLAFGEQGLPWELDPVTLETLGEFNFGGKINAISPFSAHPNFTTDGEMFNFGVSFSARQPMVNLYRFGADGDLVYRKRLPIDHPSSVHDFALGRNHIIIYVSPHVLDMSKLSGEGATLMDALSWEPERGSQLVVAQRETGESLGAIPIEPNYCLHLIGCFEEDGRVVLDVVELDRPIYDQYDVPQLFTEVRRAQPVRYVIDAEKLEVIDKRSFGYRRMHDFPATDPRKWQNDYRDFWVLGISATEEKGRKFFDQVVHCDWQLGRPAGIYQAPPRHYLGGEPVFLPKPGDERGGAVICQSFDAENERSAFLLFDAFDIARGPIAELRLKHPIHLGFHTSFYAAGAG